MTASPPKPPAASPGKGESDAKSRLAAALRYNLKRRKAAKRKADDSSPDGGTGRSTKP